MWILVALLAVVAAATQAWITRFAISPDGISYVDMAEAFARGELADVVNSYWSPLYPLLLAIPLRLFSPSPELEFVVVHAFNFVVYLMALASFLFFVREVLRHRRRTHGDRAIGLLSDRAVATIAVAIFAFAAVHLVSVVLVTPDLLLAAIVFLATGVLLRSERSPTRGTFAMLGILLALGYLAKAASFFVAFTFIATVGLFAPTWMSAVRRASIVTMSFAAVAAPWIVAVSADTQKLTIGESGRLNSIWATGEAPFPVYLPGDPGSERLLNAPRKVSDQPPAYVFASSVPGSLPLWYDPPYWYQGVETSSGLGNQLRALAERRWKYWLGALLGATAVLALLNFFRPPPLSRRAVASSLRYLLPALAAIGLYVLVHVRARYLGGYVAIVGVGIVSMISPWVHGLGRNAVLRVAVVVAIVLPLAYAATRVVQSAVVHPPPGAEAFREQINVAHGLQALGYGKDERVAVLGDRLAALNAYWVHLADMRLIAMVTRPNVYWAVDAQRRNALRLRLARSGATLLVTNDARAVEPGWLRLAGTRYHVRPLVPHDDGLSAAASGSTVRPCAARWPGTAERAWKLPTLYGEASCRRSTRTSRSGAHGTTGLARVTTGRSHSAAPSDCGGELSTLGSWRSCPPNTSWRSPPAMDE